MLFEKRKLKLKTHDRKCFDTVTASMNCFSQTPNDLQVRLVRKRNENTKRLKKKKTPTLESLQGQLLTQTVYEGEDREEGGFNV